MDKKIETEFIVFTFALTLSMLVILVGVITHHPEAEKYGIIGVLASCGYAAFLMNKEADHGE